MRERRLNTARERYCSAKRTTLPVGQFSSQRIGSSKACEGRKAGSSELLQGRLPVSRHHSTHWLHARDARSQACRFVREEGCSSSHAMTRASYSDARTRKPWLL